jgi:hypothetical protein
MRGLVELRQLRVAGHHDGRLSGVRWPALDPGQQATKGRVGTGADADHEPEATAPGSVEQVPSLGVNAAPIGPASNTMSLTGTAAALRPVR